MNYVENLTKRFPELSNLADKINGAINILIDCYRGGGKILLCGNGGSCADSEHISGELLKGFLSLRHPTPEELDSLSESLGDVELAKKLQRGIPAIPLTSLSASLSAFANDVEPSLVFGQLVFALGKAGDVIICLSTSGNSKNVVNAAKVAKARGIKIISLTGEKESELSHISDVTIKVPECETYKIQEYHLPIYHAICAEVEKELFCKD